jgi:hypothetical protein
MVSERVVVISVDVQSSVVVDQVEVRDLVVMTEGETEVIVMIEGQDLEEVQNFFLQFVLLVRSNVKFHFDRLQTSLFIVVIVL